MPSLRRILPLLLLILSVYLWYFLTRVIPAAQPITVNTANSNVSLFVEPESGRNPIINEIENAKHEILLEVYLLSDEEIINSLKRARMRGLDVRVMTEEHPFGGGSNKKDMDELSDSGVRTKWTNPSYTLTHEKTIVIDGKEVFILNQNLTKSAFTKNREYDILDGNPEDVNTVKTIFLDDWERKGFNSPATSSLVVSPVTSRKILSALISKSSKSLDIEIEDIDDSKITDIIVQEARKETVRVIIPSLSQISSNSKAINILKSGGVQVKQLSSPYIHAKLILSDNRTAYVGSVNFSAQSMDENREVGIILSNEKILHTLRQTFETDWDKGETVN
jgi:phosphatidylserine/phosphatidylglycerophosphate/cardiolipin synthase-like enzyme